MKRVLFSIGCLLMPLISLIAQNSDVFPLAMDQFYSNYRLVNPANRDTSSTFDLRLGNRSLVGAFQGVSNNYVDFNYNKNMLKDQSHAFGIAAITRAEGEYISRNRLHLRYAWRMPLTYNSSISAGISGGLVNYTLRSSGAGAGGSDMGGDLNIGFWYLREKWHLGTSLMQILEPELTPVDETIELHRFLNINGYDHWDLGPWLAVHTHAMVTWELNEQVWYTVAPLLRWRDAVEAGVQYNSSRGVIVVAGLPSYSLGTTDLGLTVSYLMINTTPLTSVRDAALEVALRLGF